MNYKTTMKNLILSLTVLFTAGLSLAQSPEYDDLKILYADADYEKLVKKAEGYTLSDKTSKDVLPYIWLAKGLYKISLSDITDEKFKNAYKDALKFMGKGMKYDEKCCEMMTIKEHEEFLHELQSSLQLRIEQEISTGDVGGFKKGFSWALKYDKITTNGVTVKYIAGACKYNSGDKPGARRDWQDGDALLKEVESIEDWSEADKNMLKMGVLHSAKAMMEANQKDSARALLGKVAMWFEGDSDWQTRYDEIVN